MAWLTDYISNRIVWFVSRKVHSLSVLYVRMYDCECVKRDWWVTHYWRVKKVRRNKIILNRSVQRVQLEWEREREGSFDMESSVPSWLQDKLLESIWTNHIKNNTTKTTKSGLNAHTCVCLFPFQLGNIISRASASTISPRSLTNLTKTTRPCPFHVSIPLPLIPPRKTRIPSANKPDWLGQHFRLAEHESSLIRMKEYVPT